MRFIAAHADQEVGGLRWGVEPICTVLSEHGCPIAPSTYYAALRRSRTPSVRQRREEVLKIEIRRVHQANFGVYGARKVWLALNREGVAVARCTVERLMNELGLVGARRGRRVRTTLADPDRAARPQDRVERNFNPPAPNRTWVADFTYVPTWSGMVYVAFVIDAYSRRILGWRAATTMKTSLVLDALEQAIWTRQQAGVSAFDELVHHNDAGSQYTSIAFTQRLTEAGVAPSVGSIGDAYDNALAESMIGLFKTELIKPRRPWRTVEQVEIACLEWVDWFNHRRLFQTCGDITPAELEQAHHRQQAAHTKAGYSTF
jgi:putative transposase